MPRLINGKASTQTLEELSKSGQVLLMGDRSVFTFEGDNRILKTMDLLLLDGSDTGEDASKKANIEIEISGPPFKIKITIKF